MHSIDRRTSIFFVCIRVQTSQWTVCTGRSTAYGKCVGHSVMQMNACYSQLLLILHGVAVAVDDDLWNSITKWICTIVHQICNPIEWFEWNMFQVITDAANQIDFVFTTTSPVIRTHLSLTVDSESQQKSLQKWIYFQYFYFKNEMSISRNDLSNSGVSTGGRKVSCWFVQQAEEQKAKKSKKTIIMRSITIQ